MTKKTVKSLDSELVKLKTEFDAMKKKCDELIIKYESLEKKCEEKNVEFNCKRCEEKFTKISDLKKHERTHNLIKGPLECKDCGKTFNEEWKLGAHIKTHEENSCDQCDKEFKSEDVRDKHVKIAHENIKLYCCFYNNDMECVYGEECIFLHKNSGSCKFGRKCVRINCMYQHKIFNTNGKQSDDTNKKDDDNDKSDGIKEIEDDESSEESLHEMDHTFLNPSQSDDAEENSKTDTEETTENDEIENNENLEEEVEYKCELCIFKTKDSKRFARHTVEIHSIKGKYLCSGCKRQFDNRKEFNNHNYYGC